MDGSASAEKPGRIKVATSIVAKTGAVIRLNCARRSQLSSSMPIPKAGTRSSGCLSSQSNWKSTNKVSEPGGHDDACPLSAQRHDNSAEQAERNQPAENEPDLRPGKAVSL